MNIAPPYKSKSTKPTINDVSPFGGPQGQRYMTLESPSYSLSECEEQLDKIWPKNGTPWTI